MMLLLAASAAQAQMIPDNVGQSSNGLPPGLVNVGFDPELHKQIPADAAFTDENGRSVQLKEYFGKKPVVLAFVYFTCPMLCNQVEQTLVGTLKMISFNPGADYEVVFISFDPSALTTHVERLSYQVENIPSIAQVPPVAWPTVPVLAPNE
jgi:protein SCO1/2